MGIGSNSILSWEKNSPASSCSENPTSMMQVFSLIFFPLFYLSSINSISSFVKGSSLGMAPRTFLKIIRLFSISFISLSYLVDRSSVMSRVINVIRLLVDLLRRGYVILFESWLIYFKDSELTLNMTPILQILLLGEETRKNAPPWSASFSSRWKRTLGRFKRTIFLYCRVISSWLMCPFPVIATS